jgi:hypothetical protein
VDRVKKFKISDLRCEGVLDIRFKKIFEFEYRISVMEPVMGEIQGNSGRMLRCGVSVNIIEQMY